MSEVKHRPGLCLHPEALVAQGYSEADARLIAAAPEMFAELARMVAAEDRYIAAFYSDEKANYGNEALDRIRALLERIKGTE